MAAALGVGVDGAAGAEPQLLCLKRVEDAVLPKTALIAVHLFRADKVILQGILLGQRLPGRLFRPDFPVGKADLQDLRGKGCSLGGGEHDGDIPPADVLPLQIQLLIAVLHQLAHGQSLGIQHLHHRPDGLYRPILDAAKAELAEKRPTLLLQQKGAGLDEDRRVGGVEPVLQRKQLFISCVHGIPPNRES